MKCYLIGGSGRLGRSIAAEYADAGIVLLERAIYREWSQPDAADSISHYFDELADERPTLFVASGLLDPRLSKDELMRVNYHLPRNLIDGAAKLGVKVVTFGTVMEGLLKTQNPYIQSKTALGAYVEQVASASRPAVHLQIHTFYGVGEPSPFMLLGLMLSAIRNNTPFKMTSGKQLREYHHLADEAKAIRQLAQSASPGVSGLSHGKPVSLRAIAESVFQALGKTDLLHVGALPEPAEENYEKVFAPTEIVRQIAFRDSLPAIVRYMTECYAMPMANMMRRTAV